MKNTFKLLGIIALAAIIGFSMTACGGGDGDGDGGGGGGGGGGGSAKKIRISGFNSNTDTKLGLTSSVEDLYTDLVLVAYAEDATETAIRAGVPLLDSATDEAWTGSGSYYVVLITTGGSGLLYPTKSKHSFKSSVTTIPFDAFNFNFN